MTQNFIKKHSGQYALIVDGENLNALLVIKANGEYESMLDLPGGRMDQGETDARVTIKREVFEETGYIINNLENLYFLNEYKFKFVNDTNSDMTSDILYHTAGIYYIDRKILSKPGDNDAYNIHDDVAGLEYINITKYQKILPTFNTLCKQDIMRRSEYESIFSKNERVITPLTFQAIKLYYSFFHYQNGMTAHIGE